MSTVLLVRHAQSAWNAEGRWQGQADPPLSERGERQAADAGHRLLLSDLLSNDRLLDLVVSSDLIRARRTAEIVADITGTRAPRLVEPSLRELNVGSWSGLTRAEIEKRWPGALAAFDLGSDVSPPGGESRAAFDARIGQATDAVARIVHEHEAQRCLVVAHGGVLRAMARLAGSPEIPVGHLSGYLAHADGGRLVLSRRVDLLGPHPARPGSSPAGVSRAEVGSAGDDGDATPAPVF